MLPALAFIIFGWPTKTKEYGTCSVAYCDHCENTSSYTLVKTRRWFSIFFVPIIPLERANYHLSCDICLVSIEVHKQHLDECKEMIQISRRFADGLISKDEYQKYLSDFNSLMMEMQIRNQSPTGELKGESESDFSGLDEEEKHENCPNCERPLSGWYDECPDCGGPVKS